MESFFHGNSSGIDPLTSYLAQPVLVQQKHRVSLVNIPVHPRGPVVFLVDTGLPRQTGPMVQWFLAQNNGEVFNKYLTRYLLPAHEKMVSGWINGDLEAFWPALRTVSEIQFHHFTPMVPDSMRDLWAAGLDGRDFVLKICGAGGGGYLLGFAADADTISRLRKTVDIIMPFQTTSGSCDTQSS
jgi:mevalonate kinase